MQTCLIQVKLGGYVLVIPVAISSWGDRTVMRRSSLDWLKDRSDEYIICRHRKAVACDGVFFGIGS